MIFTRYSLRIKCRLLPFLTLSTVLLVSASCSLTPPTPPSPLQTPPPALRPIDCPTSIASNDPKVLLHAVTQSITYYQRRDGEDSLTFGDTAYSVQELLESLKGLRNELTQSPLPAPLSSYLTTHFDCYSSTSESVLITGYYEATLRGAKTKTRRFRYPIYGIPPSLVKVDLPSFFSSPLPQGIPTTLRARVTPERRVVPFFTRAEIDFEQKLPRDTPVLAWVEDPLALFFLHIQGSGIISLTNNEIIRVNYADANGHAYKAIGTYLLTQGKLPREQISMQSILAYLRAHPEEARTILAYNPSYVFFRKVADGPLGNIQVPLTPLHSIATDSSLFPKGAPALLTRDGITTLVFNQDTGGAIKGTGRVDLFTGRGHEAEELAGKLQTRGSLLFLAPKKRTTSISK